MENVKMSQSLPNQVNDFNNMTYYGGEVTPPSRNPFQTRSTTSIQGRKGCRQGHPKLSQSLPNQVNDFNKSFKGPSSGPVGLVAIPSKPGQRLQFVRKTLNRVEMLSCRNPFQTRSTTSIGGAASGAAHLMKCRNPFQTRSTTSMAQGHVAKDVISTSRNPFQTRSTTSIILGMDTRLSTTAVAIPSKPGQRLQCGRHLYGGVVLECRNPFQTRSTTSIRYSGGRQWRRWTVSQSLPNQVNDFNSGREMLSHYPLPMSQSLPNQVNDFNI